MDHPALVRTTERLDAGLAGMARAAELLRSGRLVAFGTETVYGLGANATDPSAVADVFRAKGRPACNPLIVHCADADAAFRETDPPALARRLAAAFWPGPLTLVLPRHANSRVCAAAAAGLPTLAVRVPAQPAARTLIENAGRPVVAPSANRSGRVSPSEAAHVLAELDGRIDAVLDTGACSVGVESTVVAVRGESLHLLRPGGITVEDLEAVAGLVAVPDVEHAPDRPTAPGQMASHYAPFLPLRLDAGTVRPDEGLLAFGTPLPGAGRVWNLSPTRDLREAASRLFAGLRDLDDARHVAGLTGLAAMPIPAEGIGLAIRDRLRRAGAPRPRTECRA
ncbi:MAG: threonylcarbamoyl-AMP synthase [Gluconacetobacter diazotrophicus]|nr:threonylcarbamoyl-AMP synthase [Gluconacetobacter diazotrophicus]